MEAEVTIMVNHILATCEHPELFKKRCELVGDYEATLEYEPDNPTLGFKFLNPDGINHSNNRTFQTKEEVEEYLDVWTKGFQHQGYYALQDGGRLPIHEIKDKCVIIRVTQSGSYIRG